jgi:hypothetical protein
MNRERALPGALSPDDPVLESFHLQLDPVSRLVRAARAFIREHAPPLAPETLDVLLLLLPTASSSPTPCCTPAPPIDLGITIADRSVLITVHDEDLVRPEQLPYPEREGGWGLGLVRSLAEDFALEMHAGAGKTAWFRLSRTTPRIAELGAAGRPQDDPGEAGR